MNQPVLAGPGKFLVQTVIDRESYEFVKAQAKKDERSVAAWLRWQIIERLRANAGVIRRNRKDRK